MDFFSNKFQIAILQYLLRRVYKINQPTKKKCQVYEGIFPLYTDPTGRSNLKIFCPNRRVLSRAHSMYRKEPETIAWVDMLNDQDTLLDVGANIGLYSMLAAKKGARVVAFEPDPQNFFVLTTNVQVNGLFEKIVPLNIAVSEKSAIDYLYMPQFSFGSGVNSFGEEPQTGGSTAFQGTKQAVMSSSIDDFARMFSQYAPTVIKIDVDGLEAKIILSATEVLRSGMLRSLLVEFDETLEVDRRAIDFIQSNGFDIASKHHRSKEGTFNFVFSRK
jgi:FkbM family methyltransferase